MTRFPRTPRRRGASLVDTNRWAWSALRRTILVRDHWKCQICSAEATSVDHRIPRAIGGSDDPANLRAVCDRCQRPDERPVLAPFPAPSKRDQPEPAIVAKIRPIFGELTLGKASRR